jgi:hypothetical protein
MFPGQPTQILTAPETGYARGIVPAAFSDVDAALALAEKHDLSLVFVLFSSPTDLPAPWLTRAEGRTALATTLGTLFAEYRGNPHLLSWEVFNEPEWPIWEGRVDARDVVETVREIAEVVHAQSDALVSVGSANLQGLSLWVGMGLDYYDAHWYDPMPANVCARCVEYQDVRALYRLDRPMVVGEFYAGPDVDAKARFEDFRDRGYAGAWAWSLIPDATNDGLRVDLEASREFASSGID